MYDKLISVYENSESIEDHQVISLYEFMGSLSTEDDSIRMINYINENRNRFQFDRLKHNVSKNGSFSKDEKMKIEDSRNIGELLDVFDSKLPQYCFSGYYDTQQEKYIHSGLYTLEFRAIEREILRHKLNNDPYVIIQFPSFDGNSIIAIVLGKKESTPIGIEEVSRFHSDNFDEIYRYYVRNLDFIPNRKYSNYSEGISQPYLEDTVINKDVDEFFWRKE